MFFFSRNKYISIPKNGKKKSCPIDKVLCCEIGMREAEKFFLFYYFCVGTFCGNIFLLLYIFLKGLT